MRRRALKRMPLAAHAATLPGRGVNRDRYNAFSRQEYAHFTGRFAVKYAATMNTGTANFKHLQVLDTSSYDTDTSPTVRAGNTGTKILMYKAAADMSDEGTGSVTPSQTVRFASAGSPVTYNEALEHDINVPGDKWVLRDAGGAAISAYGFAGKKMGDISKASYRQQWVARCLEQLDTQQLWDGVFIDNVLAHFATPASATPTVFAADWSQQYEDAMQGFVAYVGEALERAGWYVCCNTHKFISGNTDSNNGVLEQAWWRRVGPYVSAMFCEQGFASSGQTQVRLNNSSSFLHFWLGWCRDLMQASYDTGCDPWINLTFNTAGESSHIRYARASAMLFWRGLGGGVSWFSTANDDQYATSASWAFELGMPVGTLAQDANGCFTRRFAGGWVAVNPTTLQQTVDVGGTPRVIGSGDAYIGA